MNKEPKTQLDVGRRQFLSQVAAGGGAVAVGVAVAGTIGRVESIEPAAAPARTPQSKGYQETAHVRRYYETTRI